VSLHYVAVIFHLTLNKVYRPHVPKRYAPALARDCCIVTNIGALCRMQAKLKRRATTTAAPSPEYKLSVVDGERQSGGHLRLNHRFHYVERVMNKCVSVLSRGLEACSSNESQITSLDLVINPFFIFNPLMPTVAIWVQL